MAIIKKELPLVFQYIQISSPIPFYIYGSDNEKAKRLLPSNAYVLRSAELLTSEKAPNQPIWKVYVEYDDNLLNDGRTFEINGFNVDFSKYLETFGGQLVRFGDDQLSGLYAVINTPSWTSILSTLATSAKQDSILEKIPGVGTLATWRKQDNIYEKIPSVAGLATSANQVAFKGAFDTLVNRLSQFVYCQKVVGTHAYTLLDDFEVMRFSGMIVGADFSSYLPLEIKATSEVSFVGKSVTGDFILLNDGVFSGIRALSTQMLDIYNYLSTTVEHHKANEVHGDLQLFGVCSYLI